MRFTHSLYRAERWTASASSRLTRSIKDLTAVYDYADLYPETEHWSDGESVMRSEVMPHQSAFHNRVTPSGHRANYTLFSGGVGSGKTMAACVDAVYKLRRFPGIRIVCVAPYDYYFDETVWPAFQSVLDFEDPFVVRANIRTRTIEVANGSSIRFRAYPEPNRVKGWEAHVIWVEEGSELGQRQPEKAKGIYDALLQRLRAKPEWIPREVFVNQNPAGHNWLWRIFVKSNPADTIPNRAGDRGIAKSYPPCKLIKSPNKVDPQVLAAVRQCQQSCTEVCSQYPRGYEYCEFERVSASGQVFYTVSCGTRANKFLPDGYEEGLRENLGEAEISRMINGQFNPINSLVYEWPWFSERTHVIPLEAIYCRYGIDPQEGIPVWWPIYCGIDVGGNRSPWAIEVYVITPDGEAIGIDEWYKAGVEWMEVATNILRLTDGYQKVQYFIDPYSSPQKQGPDQQSVMDTFARYGIPVQKPKGYNRTGGWQHVRSLLKRDCEIPCPYLQDTVNEETGEWEIGAARLYYVEGAMPYNLKEKEVWRFDTRKIREGKEWEEGLEAPLQEKAVDRSDHAQTSEMFALGGWSPMPNRRGLPRRRLEQGPVRQSAYRGKRYQG